MFTKHFPAFAYGDFRLLWSADLITRTGTQLLTVAISWQLYLLTNSPLALGLIGVVQLIPLLLLNFVGGVVADSHNRKKILFITLPLLAVCSFLLGVTTFTHTISPLIMYILIAVAAGVSCFYLPAYGSILPTIIDKKDLGVANSTFTIAEDFSELVGPALAGFLIASIGVGNLYFLDALSTLVAFVAVLFMHFSGEQIGEKSKLTFHAVKEGYDFLVTKPVMWSSMLLDTLSVIFVSFFIVMPVFAKDILHVGPQGLGLLYAAPAAGALLVGFFLARGMHIYNQGKVLLMVIAVFSLAIIVFGLSTSFVLSLLALAIIGGANVISVTIRAVIRQTFTPSNMLGRLYSFYSFFWISGDKLGDIKGGFLTQLFGAPVATVIGGIGGLLVVCSMAIFNPKLREYKQEIQ